MFRPLLGLAAVVLLAIALAAEPARAQEWRPSTRAMPNMPRVQDLSGDWMSTHAAWLSGVQAVSGVSQSRLRPVAEGRGATAQVVRFNDGPAPAMVWQDRNGDGRADIVEIFRAGGVIIQIIDADYDGQANVLRRYDASGRLLAEERL